MLEQRFCHVAIFIGAFKCCSAKDLRLCLQVEIIAFQI